MPLLNLNPALKRCHLNTTTGSLILPAGRMLFPALFVPRAMKGEPPDTAKFQVSIIFPKDADLTLAAKHVADLAADKWGAKSTKPVKKPFLPYAEKTADVELAVNFPVMLRCASSAKPGVVFGNNDECTTQQEVYGGRWAMVSVRGYAWEHPTGGRGVSFGLNNVMLLDHDDPIGNARPKTETDFADMFAYTGGSNNPDKLFEREAVTPVKTNGGIDLFN
jgi:hypothetical protein